MEIDLDREWKGLKCGPDQRHLRYPAKVKKQVIYRGPRKEHWLVAFSIVLLLLLQVLLEQLHLPIEVGLTEQQGTAEEYQHRYQESQNCLERANKPILIKTTKEYIKTLSVCRLCYQQRKGAVITIFQQSFLSFAQAYLSAQVESITLIPVIPHTPFVIHPIWIWKNW